MKQDFSKVWLKHTPSFSSMVWFLHEKKLATGMLRYDLITVFIFSVQHVFSFYHQKNFKHELIQIWFKPQAIVIYPFVMLDGNL